MISHLQSVRDVYAEGQRYFMGGNPYVRDKFLELLDAVKRASDSNVLEQL